MCTHVYMNGTNCALSRGKNQKNLFKHTTLNYFCNKELGLWLRSWTNFFQTFPEFLLAACQKPGSVLHLLCRGRSQRTDLEESVPAHGLVLTVIVSDSRSRDMIALISTRSGISMENTMIRLLTKPGPCASFPAFASHSPGVPAPGAAGIPNGPLFRLGRRLAEPAGEGIARQLLKGGEPKEDLILGAWLGSAPPFGHRTIAR